MSSAAPLAGIVVLDLSRILAGPTATQALADLGAEVIKIERPGHGDDTRKWGPPFVRDSDGRETSESAYYLSANRGKKSVAINIAEPEGQSLIRKLAEKADILIENFKSGDMARYGLDYASLSDVNPRLIYCSITGFGQTGPNAHRAGYDFLIQGEAGIMSLTGEADGRPLKVGVGIADVMCGMYALTGILAALQARHRSGRGQHIDVCLYDTQVAWLINQGVGYLTDGQVPPRRGNDHPTIVPYGAFPASDGEFIIAIGNDAQFRRFVSDAGRAELADDPRFATNAERVRNRAELIPIIEEMTRMRPASCWLERLEALSVPGGPINDLRQVFDSPQVAARDMRISLPHPLAGGGNVDLIGNPLKFSDTPVHYGNAPPLLGQHTAEVLRDHLGLARQELDRLKASGVIGEME
ncbi:CaiB/BaiF CoA transferase family protein [Paracoccus alkanivorans]|uniref:CoA transferase n=1 Tax=Paracoccus alkanivorans TaxID=2116655 RepID=A0A3M0MCE8_9RHOB|nr:CaiB/BaiF CoA-transferase family protein [Paracoccus alkanivorans]RMC35442.1 CoA transferase [Paracoccus alkanivorans]